jgi:hypothetical protein
MKQAKGWRRFYDRGLHPCETRVPFHPTWRSRSLIAPKGNPGSTRQKPRGNPWKRQGDRSDGRQEIRPPKSPIRLEPWISGRAPALHALRASHDPCLRCFPSVSPMRGGCSRIPSGALRTPFIQRQITISEIEAICKEIVSKSFFGRTAPALIAFAVVRERSGRPRPEPAAARRFLAAKQSRVSAARHIFRLQNVCKYAHDAIG